jgi:hypothetical protein
MDDKPMAGGNKTAEGYIGAEAARLCDAAPWRVWGPYTSDRQWGTVREDYSADGDAWRYFPHDHARSRAYRWGEDALAGFSDDQQRLCFGLGLWNGRDAIIKERLFGLNNAEGNHGEDVKELYFYTDATPTHSYMRMLYKYPQDVFPYDRLLDENRGRGRAAGEFEILDTGVFDDAGFFDVVVEYAKAPNSPQACMCCRNYGRATPGLGLRARQRRLCGSTRMMWCMRKCRRCRRCSWP